MSLSIAYLASKGLISQQGSCFPKVHPEDMMYSVACARILQKVIVLKMELKDTFIWVQNILTCIQSLCVCHAHFLFVPKCVCSQCWVMLWSTSLVGSLVRPPATGGTEGSWQGIKTGKEVQADWVRRMLQCGWPVSPRARWRGPPTRYKFEW